MAHTLHTLLVVYPCLLMVGLLHSFIHACMHDKLRSRLQGAAQLRTGQDVLTVHP